MAFGSRSDVVVGASKIVLVDEAEVPVVGDSERD
jgi:hypothetical protein